jgi:unspecific monooxygenase
MDTVLPSPLIPARPPIPPDALSFFALLRAIRTNALTMWPEAAYTDDMLVRGFLGGTSVLLNMPDAIHRVLVENAGNYRRSPASIRILRAVTGEGLLLSEGDAWRHQRRTIAPSLAPRVMPMLARCIAATTQEALERLAPQIARPVDMLATMQSVALEIAGRSMFSLEMRVHGPALRAMLLEYGERFAQPRLLDMLLPASVPTLHDMARRRFHRRWMRLIETIMQPRLHTPPTDPPRDLFDLLRAARDPETGAAFSAVELRDQVATLILAGHETTAVTLFWASLLLAQDQSEQSRVAAEVDGRSLDAEAAMGVLPQLVRTRAVINETLRLYPPAFVVVRQSVDADRLGDFDLPGRSIVMVAPWVLHRHRALWHDPDTFAPGRFMPEAVPQARFAYMPFGAGPRICVGAQFALTEAVLVLASLVQRFVIACDDPRPVLPVAIVTTQPDHAPLFRLRLR